MPTSEGELQEDTIANRLANSVGVSTTVIPVHTTILRVLTPIIVCPEIRKTGEPSSICEFKSILAKPLSPIKVKGKNTLRKERAVFPWPIPDEEKLLKEQIIAFKRSKDAARRELMAIIYRDGKEIHICGSHPNFVEAKAEEAARLQKEAKTQTPNEPTSEEASAGK